LVGFPTNGVLLDGESPRGFYSSTNGFQPAMSCALRMSADIGNSRFAGCAWCLEQLQADFVRQAGEVFGPKFLIDGAAEDVEHFFAGGRIHRLFVLGIGILHQFGRQFLEKSRRV
jgi:hypothetical protein